jgi:nucleotide-binding universal stress UspA family protein
MFKRILVPTDGTERSAGALAIAMRLAQLNGGCVIGLHVTAGPGPLDLGLDSATRYADAHELRQETQDALAYVKRCARAAAVPCDTVEAGPGPPHEAIIRTARDRMCDLIVMTTRSRGGLRARLLTGTTQRVLDHSAIPVLVVRADHG